MLTAKDTHNDITIPHGNIIEPSKGLASDALPDAPLSPQDNDLHTGVSTQNVHSQTDESRHWYALRATYGRELKAYKDITEAKGIAFCPTITEYKIVNGKRKAFEVSRFPNILFAYGTEDEIKAFAYDNVQYKYLRFYYKHRHEGHRIVKEPLIVPDHQMESLQIICASEANDVVIVPQDAVIKFQQGEHVRITGGAFAGVEGYVARFYGQQRVAVIIDGLVSIATAYVPSVFLEKKEKNKNTINYEF